MNNHQSPDPPPSFTVSQAVFIGMAALTCFALGWLGYGFLHKADQDDALIEAIPASPSGLGREKQPSIVHDNLQMYPENQSGDVYHPKAVQLSSPSLQCLQGDQAELNAPADSSNFGSRQMKNWRGQSVSHWPSLIVLHETVVSLSAALAQFQRRQSDDLKQASYHVLIDRDGRRIRVVDDSMRAFGAGDSDYRGTAVQLRPAIPPSVNNFALHVSLVSPPDGADGERPTHSGYTPAQYTSLARQLALWQNLYGIASTHIVTHQEIDRSGSRRDPRSFEWNALSRQLQRQLIACGGVPGNTAGLDAGGR